MKYQRHYYHFFLLAAFQKTYRKDLNLEKCNKEKPTLTLNYYISSALKAPGAIAKFQTNIIKHVRSKSYIQALVRDLHFQSKSNKIRIENTRISEVRSNLRSAPSRPLHSAKGSLHSTCLSREPRKQSARFPHIREDRHGSKISRIRCRKPPRSRVCFSRSLPSFPHASRATRRVKSGHVMGLSPAGRRGETQEGPKGDDPGGAVSFRPLGSPQVPSPF